MGYRRMSITVPDDVYQELKTYANDRNIKLSCLVTDAIREKNRRLKEEAFVQQVNSAFEDASIREEQTAMAEAIAEYSAVDELPW